MPSKNKTPLGLNQWEGEDRPKKDDFNADNQKIDLACRSALQSLSQHLEEGGHLSGEQAGELQALHVHMGDGVATELGMHGIRYFGDKLQVNAGGQWVDVVAPVAGDGAGGGDSDGHGTGSAGYKVYGVCIDTANSDPFGSATYTDDAAGMSAGSVLWDEEQIFKGIRPCMLSKGVVRYYLDPNDYGKRADGSPANHTTGADGDVMVEIPRMAWMIYKEGDLVYIKVTAHPNAKSIDRRFCYFSHTRKAEGDRRALYVGAYLATEAEGKFRSISGTTPATGGDMPAFRQKAQANGPGYDMLGYYPHILLQCLYLIRYRSLESQQTLGMGFTHSSPFRIISTGATDAKGMYFGDTDFDAGSLLQVKCHGVEDLWGHLLCMLDGAYQRFDGHICTAFDNFADGHTSFTERCSIVKTQWVGFIKSIWGGNHTGFLPSENVFMPWAHFGDTSVMQTNTDNFLSVGGHNMSNIGAGIFHVNCMPISPVPENGRVDTGTRLMYL